MRKSAENDRREWNERFEREKQEWNEHFEREEQERKKEKKEWNQRWGELANAMGRLVEDIIAPNIPRIAKTCFGFVDIEDFMVRRKVRAKKDRSKRREFDVIAVSEDKVLINETKTIPRIDYIDKFLEALEQIDDYFPEYQGRTIIPVFASLYIGQDVVTYLTRHKIYAMAMGEEMMDILNFEQVRAIE